jgi:hypothetical protein
LLLPKQRGLKNLWLFRHEIWNFAPWDFEPMLRLMQKSSREMSKHMKEHAMVKGSEKASRELLVFSELCRRLADDDVYYEDPYFHYKGKRREFYKRVRYRYNYDLEYLRRMLKHMPHWWD